MGFREWLAHRAGVNRRILNSLQGDDRDSDAAGELQKNIAFYGAAADAFAEYRTSEVFENAHIP